MSRTLWFAAGPMLVGLLAIAIVGVRGLPASAPDPAALSSPHIVFAEFGLTADQIYIAPADAPDERTLVDTVEHAEGWGINPGAMRGHLVAYTVLPPGAAPERDVPAELWLLDVSTNERTRLARDADLLIKPQFIDAGTLIYRHSDGNRQAIVRVEVETSARSVVYEEQTAFGILPIGYDASGALLFSRLSTGGTDIYRMPPDEDPRLLLHASDEIARDWQLSPDGRALAYLAPEVSAERVVYRAHVVDLGGGTLSWPQVATEGEHYGPTWTPEGALAVGQEAATGAAPVALLQPGKSPGTLAPPERGFDVPVAWSSGGEYLAARTFDGANSTMPGRESAVVIGSDGQRFPLAAAGEIILMGWLPSA
ncbi:MAG: hypothetical protein WD734_02855 [Dehalococcoidia bacterium]